MSSVASAGSRQNQYSTGRADPIAVAEPAASRFRVAWSLHRALNAPVRSRVRQRPKPSGTPHLRPQPTEAEKQITGQGLQVKEVFQPAAEQSQRRESLRPGAPIRLALMQLSAQRIRTAPRLHEWLQAGSLLMRPKHPSHMMGRSPGFGRWITPELVAACQGSVEIDGIGTGAVSWDNGNVSVEGLGLKGTPRVTGGQLVSKQGVF